ncbi:YncE family protein [Sulfidibacter corallicola]|uniref:YncE family protein n=1 Tax=Sulfidibacter corallicola TaxID=2818388 RepID=A0A8A4TFN5_SULCO|nr:YncE family protein [Sulfidibacter corallicola]QTD48002.1 YncE family protein [Sulfidibacter corallicola]
MNGNACLPSLLFLLIGCWSWAGSDGPVVDAAAKASGTSRRASAAFERTFREQGIDVTLRMMRLTGSGDAGHLIAGDRVRVQLHLRDAGGQPIRNANPAAWLDKLGPGEPRSAETCRKKVELFLAGSLLAAPTFDLNQFHVITLNADGTLSVLDPRFSFGGSRLLALVELGGIGGDWVLSSDTRTLLVTLPAERELVDVDTATWTVRRRYRLRGKPRQVAIAPDRTSIWVVEAGEQGQAGGVSVIRPVGGAVVGRVPCGPGATRIAFGLDRPVAFVIDAEGGTLTLIDRTDLEVLKRLEIGAGPVALAVSSLAGSALVVHRTGKLTAVDEKNPDAAFTLQDQPGLMEVRFTPDGRFALILNTEKDEMLVFDSVSRRIVQRCDVLREPDQIAFSDTLAYVRHRGSDHLLAFPLGQIGAEGATPQAVDVPAGDHPVGRMAFPTPAPGMVQAVGAQAMMIANPGDDAVYFYKEGMAAPMGQVPNYGRRPRAVIALDRSLTERREAGVYESDLTLAEAGRYDFVLFVDSIPSARCFAVIVAPEPKPASATGPVPVIVSMRQPERRVLAGQPAAIEFRVTDAGQGRPNDQVPDLQVLVQLVPGIWHRRFPARPLGEGKYRIEVELPKAGIYTLHPASRALGLRFHGNRFYLRVGGADTHQTEKEVR